MRCRKIGQERFDRRHAWWCLELWAWSLLFAWRAVGWWCDGWARWEASGPRLYVGIFHSILDLWISNFEELNLELRRTLTLTPHNQERRLKSYRWWTWWGEPRGDWARVWATYIHKLKSEQKDLQLKQPWQSFRVFKLNLLTRKPAPMPSILLGAWRGATSLIFCVSMEWELLCFVWGCNICSDCRLQDPSCVSLTISSVYSNPGLFVLPLLDASEEDFMLDGKSSFKFHNWLSSNEQDLIFTS
jgi:hypothetical protein